MMVLRRFYDGHVKPGYLALAIAPLALSACASQPDKIAAHSVSPIQYAQYDCAQITQEMTRVSSRASALQGTLQQKADVDSAQMAAGLILFWPTLFFLEGGDGPDAQEYARLKGEQAALDQASIERRCFHAPSAPVQAVAGTGTPVAATSAVTAKPDA